MSPHQDPSDALLARYIDGDCTAAERHDIEAQLGRSPSLGQRVAELRVLLASEPRPATWNADRIWSALITHRRAARVFAVPREKHAFSFSIAAALLVLVGGGAVWLRTHSREAPVPSALDAADGHYTTSRSQYATITLTDGSRVTLAPESRLTVPASFGEASRSLSLEGEAIFDVRHDAARPFRVRVRRAVIQDIGTRFDLREYSDDAAVTVAVVEGAASLERLRSDSVTRDAHTAKDVVLHPGQVGRMDARGTLSSASDPRLSRYFAWARGRLVFVAQPLPDVLRTIGRWYDLEIHADDPLLARRVTAEFSTQTPSEIVDALAIAVNATVERRGRVVTLRSK
jgi:transmembrane sensor